MKKIKLFSPYQVKLGAKLFFASIAFAMGNFVLAGMCMMFPTVENAKGFITGILLTGSAPVDVTTEEGQKKLLETITSKVKEVTDKAAEGKISQKELDAAVEKLNKEITKLNDASLAELKKRADEIATKNDALVEENKKINDALKTQSDEIKKLKDGGVTDKGDKPATFKEALREAFMSLKEKGILKEKNDEYGQRLSMKDFFEQRKDAMTPVITIKAAVDMFQSNIVGNYVNNIRLTELDANRVSIPLTIYPHVINVFMSKPISKPYMSLLVVYTYEDGSETKVEGAASGKSSFLLKTVEFKAFFIAANFNLSDETLDDLDEVMAEIELVAPDKLLDKMDAKILRATGDDATDIKGIFHADKSTPYANQMGANAVQDAYIVDLIADAKLQIEKNKYRPNVIYINPTDFTLLTAKKNNFADSLSDKRVSYNNLGEPVAVCGLAIVKSESQPVDTLLVLDNRQPWIGKRKDLTMEIGYSGADFVEGQRTVKLQTRVAFGVRDKAGVVYVAAVATAIAALKA